jgi:uncharacterized protein with von Willebrand factor type A (vWA) domain
MTEKITAVQDMGATKAALSALGQAWRGDWSEFDGRTLRSQLNEITDLLDAERRGEDTKRPLAAFYAGNDICGRCQSWTEYCDCGVTA